MKSLELNLLIDILMDGPPAQSLGVEPVDPSIMTRPPRHKTARVLTKPLIQRVLTSAGIIMLGTLLVYVHEMGEADDISTPTPSDSPSMTPHHSRIVNAHDTTMTFTCFVLFDMFNALACRSESKSILFGELPLFGNKMFNYAVLGSLLGQTCVIYLPFLQRIFQTESLAFADLIKLIMIASVVFWVDEGRKYLKRLDRRRRGLGLSAAGYSINV